MGIGNNIETFNNKPNVNNFNIIDYNGSVFSTSNKLTKKYFSNQESKIDSVIPKKILSEGAIGSPWPMYCHDAHHTGRSPYSTANNTGYEKWNYPLKWEATGGVVIDEEGSIYIGGDGLYAINFNGTLRWKFTTNYKIYVTPAIDENGVIYFGTIYASPDYLHAVIPVMVQ